MKNGYYTFSDLVEVEGKRFSDPNFVKTLMAGVSSKGEMIDAIENYNETHNLNEKERIKYSIGIGEIYINVIHAYKLGNQTTYAIIGRDNNGYGILTKSADPSKSNTFDTTLSTHIVDVADITDVWFSGYDIDKIGNILKDTSGTDEIVISTKELENTLTELKTQLNVLLSTGEYRMYFNKFTYTMKSKNLNSISYENKPTAYNTYVSIWTNYISTVENILANYVETGINIDSLDNIDNMRNIPNLLFVEASTDQEIIDIIKEKIKNKFNLPADEYNYNHYVESIFRKTFSTSDIETFKSIVSKTAEQDPDPDPQNP